MKSRVFQLLKSTIYHKIQHLDELSVSQKSRLQKTAEQIKTINDMQNLNQTIQKELLDCRYKN
jgi:hypothetical protein